MTAVVVKAMAVLLITAMMALTISAHKPEYAFILCLAGGGAVLLAVLGSVLPQVNALKNAVDNVSGAEYFSVALKALGISYITGFVADTCRDFGQSSLAAKAELAGKCAIFILCVPLAVSVLNSALKFAGI